MNQSTNNRLRTGQNSDEVTRNGYASQGDHVGCLNGTVAFNPSLSPVQNGIHDGSESEITEPATASGQADQPSTSFAPISIQMSTMRPFEEQIAGHGLVDGKVLLKHPDGRVLKPKQAPPKGTREVGFYESLAKSNDPTDEMIRRVVPTFYGTAISEKVRQQLPLCSCRSTTRSQKYTFEFGGHVGPWYGVQTTEL